MRLNALYYAAFASGAAVMALEVIGLGVLAPYYGTALLVSTNVIGITLISLTIGYRLGGAWADTHPPSPFKKILGDERAVGILLCITTLWIGLIFPWRGVISNIIGWIIPTNSLGSFFTTAALFGFPCMTLGMVLPYLIKLRVREVAVSGTLSGTLYGLSAAGSIFGTLIIGLFILPRFQYGVAFASIVVLLTIGAFLLKIRWQYCLGVGALSIILLLGVSPPDFLFYKNPIFSDGKMVSDKTTWKKLADTTSIFSRLQVYEGVEKKTLKPVRFLLVNGEIHSATYLDSNDLAFNYARYNRLGGHFNPAAKHALLVGGGAYSYANYFLADTPLYDREKVWELEGKYYYNNKTISVPILLTNNSSRLDNEAKLVYVSTSTPSGRAAIEGEKNKIVAHNQNVKKNIIVAEADIFETGFPTASGYVHVHETKNDGTPGRVISADIPVGSPTMIRPRSIIGDGPLISGHNENVVVPLNQLDRPLRDGEVLYTMLHRDNGNGHMDPLLVDGYEQIESLDVVEIDPRTTTLAEKYFHLNSHDPRLRIFNEDGRTYLNHSTNTYDIIYLDAFQSFYGAPWQLTTIEATKNIFRLLNDNGVVVVNVPAALEGDYSKFFQAEFKTYQAVFPEVRAYAVSSPNKTTMVQNIIVVAFKNKEGIRKSPNDDPEINEQLTHLWLGKISPTTPILTDDFAPIDYYANMYINLHSF